MSFTLQPPVNKSSINRIRLAEFLRNRRERLQPADFGLPTARRRRTPGLRRDDVAELAGISLAYYTWIEQGRELNLSREVLDSITGALRLNIAERNYVATLAGLPSNDEIDFGYKLHPTVLHMLQDSSMCAYVRDPWFNVLDASPLARKVLSMSQGGNVLRRLCFDRSYGSMWSDHKHWLRLLIGQFRQSLANDPESSAGNRVLQELSSHPDFASLWNTCDVQLQPSPEDFFREEPLEMQHPDVGLLQFHVIAVALPNCNQCALVMFSPSNDITSKKFQQLSSNKSHSAKTAQFVAMPA